jgi:hypothetical protein
MPRGTSVLFSTNTAGPPPFKVLSARSEFESLGSHCDAGWRDWESAAGKNIIPTTSLEARIAGPIVFGFILISSS